MNIKTCTCSQCRAKKANARPALKKRIKRYLNRARRRGDVGKVVNFYRA